MANTTTTNRGRKNSGLYGCTTDAESRAAYHHAYYTKNRDKQAVYTLKSAARKLERALGCAFIYDGAGIPIAVKAAE